MGLLALSPTACQHSNYRLDAYDVEQGYRFDLVDRDEDKDSTFICLTFSGGGTRAAAFAYGVLQALHKTKIPGDPDGQSLLDEVDLISAVSGGSFTAMGYAKWGDELFNPNDTNEFRDRFLTRNIHLAIPLSFLTPRYLVRTPLVLLDLIHTASIYYGEEIYDKLTYGELIKLDRRPFVVINATDVSRRQRFEFTQDDFDLLGADMAKLPVGCAVAASSAVPVLFSPLRIPYFHGPALSGIVDHVLDESPKENVRRRRWARSLLGGHGGKDERVTDRGLHRFLFLLDGGLSDNLGLDYVIESYRSGPIRDRLNDGRIDRFILIIVDAGNESPHSIESRFVSPNLFDLIEIITLTGKDVRTAGLTETAKYEIGTNQTATRKAFEHFSAAFTDNCPGGVVPQTPLAGRVEQYVIDLNLDQVDDLHGEESDRLISTATSLSLPEKKVDALIEAGREVLKKHPEFKRLICDLEREALLRGD